MSPSSASDGPRPHGPGSSSSVTTTAAPQTTAMAACQSRLLAAPHRAELLARRPLGRARGHHHSLPALTSFRA